MIKSALVALAFALGTLSGYPQISATGQVWTPDKVVENVWKLATQGDLLSPEGWDKMARGFFLHPAPSPGSKLNLIKPTGDKVILVVSNGWGIVNTSVEGSKARVAVEYYDAGRIDAKLRYTPGKEPDPIGKTEMLYTLVFAPTHWETYKGNGLEIAEVRTGPDGWQIETPQGPRWTTVNTAIRYVLEMRNKTTDPAVRKNADETLTRLLQLPHY